MNLNVSKHLGSELDNALAGTCGDLSAHVSRNLIPLVGSHICTLDNGEKEQALSRFSPARHGVRN